MSISKASYPLWVIRHPKHGILSAATTIIATGVDDPLIMRIINGVGVFWNRKTARNFIRMIEYSIPGSMDGYEARKVKITMEVI